MNQMRRILNKNQSISGFYFVSGSGSDDFRGWGRLDGSCPGALSAHVALSTTSHHCGRSGQGSSAGGPGGHSSRTDPGGDCCLSADFITEEDFTWEDIQQPLPGQIPQPRRERRRENFWLLLRDFFFFFFYHISVTLEVKTCLSWERMGPLLLSIALCLSAAVPQHVKGEWKSDWLSLSLSKHFTRPDPSAWEYHKLLGGDGGILTDRKWSSE